MNTAVQVFLGGSVHGCRIKSGMTNEEEA